MASQDAPGRIVDVAVDIGDGLRGLVQRGEFAIF